jgi:hypothetical protein
MGLYKAIQELHAVKRRLDGVITSLEDLQRETGGIPPMPKGAKQRGRKFMRDQERQAVSERMKRYWSNRREARVSGVP